jgi:hypothetical protein
MLENTKIATKIAYKLGLIKKEQYDTRTKDEQSNMAIEPCDIQPNSSMCSERRLSVLFRMDTRKNRHISVVRRGEGDSSPDAS